MLDPKINNIYEIIREAEKSVVSGDMYKAKLSYNEAASILHKLINNHKGQERISVAVSAAILYFQAGEYTVAKSVLDMVWHSKIDPEVVSLYNEIRNKISINYVNNFIAKVDKLTKDECWPALLEELANNPYFLPPAEMAKMRAKACAALNKHDLALEFENDAKRLS